MQSRWIAIVFVAAGMLGGCSRPSHRAHYEVWTVRPAPGGKWMTCLEEDNNGPSCGGPTSLDEASWWSATKGGRDVQP